MCLKHRSGSRVNINYRAGYYLNDPNSQSNIFSFEGIQGDFEDILMFALAVVLFCAGAVVAIINAYCMGTRCMKVGSNREFSHFSPCTFY